jgi:hypothetical protein
MHYGRCKDCEGAGRTERGVRGRQAVGVVQYRCWNSAGHERTGEYVAAEMVVGYFVAHFDSRFICLDCSLTSLLIVRR